MAEQAVQFEVEADRAVCRVTLDRPEKLNALNEAVRAGLQEAIDELALRDDVRVVVLAGAGRAFSSGADLREPGTLWERGTPAAAGSLEQRRLSGRWQRLLEGWERLPQATVAELHGHVIGGAALLAAACDLRVASDDVSVAIPELAIGIPLTWAGLPRLAREIGLPRTRELVMTGRRLLADEACAWGYVHRVASPGDLRSAVDELAGELLGQPPTALAMTVDALRALGRAVSASEVAWADPDLLRWSLRDLSRGEP